ncbi:TIM21-domain-containing protein [Bombardia bombarda]|uniref:Mitochondrial import inner membrane translocase subunit Tim21 n=1 Tax=Bombardia bombarda TaxID=252184 RepID=A0AA39XND0_9PEZI|nr:TIM21-domain-containing protein [Bombardia bombarda]
MMKISTAPGLRSTTATAALTSLLPSSSPAIRRRCYATQQQQQTGSAGPESSHVEARRRAVTPFNDDGHVPWTSLSKGEKAARATQQTFNFGLVVMGVLLSGGVGYLLYTEVFSPESKTAYFNSAVNRIKKDPRCLELLGDAGKISAHGDETFNKWRRARPIASSESKDARGNEHLAIKFYVEGPKGQGAVHMHLIKYANHSDYAYQYFYLDVKGHQRIYLERADAGAGAAKGNDKGFKLFGVNWR